MGSARGLQTTGWRLGSAEPEISFSHVKPARCPVRCFPFSQRNWLMVNGVDYLLWRKRGLFWKGEMILWREIARSPNALAANKAAEKERWWQWYRVSSLMGSLSAEWSVPLVRMLGLVLVSPSVKLLCMWVCASPSFTGAASLYWIFFKCFDALGWKLL